VTLVGYSFKAAVNSAIYSGFIKDQHSSTLAQCSTGNCTWDPFPTLAVCGKCTNITDQIEHDSGGSYVSQYGLYLQGFSLSDNTGYINSTIHVVKEEAGTGNATLIHIGMIGRTDKVGDGGTGYIQAEDCVLQYCVQVIQPNFTSGLFSEKVLANFTQWNSSYNLSSGSNPIYSPSGSLINWPDPLSLTKQTDLQSDLNTNFTIDPWALLEQRKWLGTMLDVKVWADEEEDISYNASDAGVVEAIYSNGIGNLSNTMNAMSESLTTQMRIAPAVWEDITGLTNKTTGVAHEMIAIVHVAWLWLIFPAVVEIVGVAFVLATIILNSRSEAKLWKTSVLPMLFHGLDDELRKTTRGFEELNRMEEEAEKLRVRLGVAPLEGSTMLLKA
jgi:hypothetical protein